MRNFFAGMSVIAGFMTMTSAAPAQETGGASRFDVGVYAGAAWTSPWLETQNHRWAIGTNPIFGAFGTAWATPRVGFRGHLAYMQSGMPEPRGAAFDLPPQIDGRRLHTWFYDLNLAARPFMSPERVGSRLSSVYFLIGGGGLTANPDLGDPEACVPPYDHGGACLSNDWRKSTVGQVTAGAGLGLIPLTRYLSIFAEAAVHAYDSPFHMGEAWTGVDPCPNDACRAADRTAVTTRLVGGLVLALGAARAAPALIPAVPPPPPAAPAPPPEAPITICVVVEGLPRYVDAFVQPQTGDTVVTGPQGIRRPLRAAYPASAATASGRDWFLRDEPLFLNGRAYVKFGIPRTLEPSEIVRIGEYSGIPLFTPIPAGEPEGGYPTLYIPVEDGCLFQPYQPRARVGRVRG